MIFEKDTGRAYGKNLVKFWVDPKQRGTQRNQTRTSSSSVGQVDRFAHVAHRSLCPGPNRPLDTKKVIGNTGNHLRSRPKIWIFVDFQAKSKLYAIT